MKNYIKPSSKTVRLEMENSLLTGSNHIRIDQSDDYYDAGESYSSKKDGYWGGEAWDE